jgi:two-component system LytT family response regulator
MNIKCIIIDDEKHGIITLEHMLKKIADVQIVATTQNSEEARHLINLHQPHIVFLDIEMPKFNGFEVLAQFEELPFKVVFTTAYDQYAIKALKWSALDYLLKPIDAEELHITLDKFRHNDMALSMEQVLQVQQFRAGALQDTIALSIQEGLQFIKIIDIAYLEAQGNYTTITMVDGTKHLASKSLMVFEEVLCENPIFFRAHKSYLVNLKCLKQFNRKDGGELIMMDNNSILLSRSKKQEFLELFKRI